MSVSSAVSLAIAGREMELYAVRWPNGTYAICVPAGDQLPTVAQPELWVGQGSSNPQGQEGTLLDGDIVVVGLRNWQWWYPGTILLRIPEQVPWERLEPVLTDWLCGVFKKSVKLQEITSW